MNRALLLAAVAILAVAPAIADSEKDAAEVVSNLATALSGDNAAGFLKVIDPSIPGFEKLRGQIRAMLAKAEVSSSISVLDNEGDDVRRTMSVDWYIELRARGVGDQTEPRRRTVRCVVAKSGKTWRVVELDAAGLFD